MKICILKSGMKFLLILVSLLLIINLSHGADKDTIRVGIYQNYPTIYMNEEGQPSGIFVDLLSKIAENENWQLDYIPADWDSCLIALEKGHLDLMPDVAFNSRRNQIFYFNKISVLESWSQVYVQPKSDIVTIADLEGKRIALLNGSIHASRFKKLMNGFNIPYKALTMGSYAECFALVQHDSADAVIANNLYGEIHYPEAGLEKTPIVFNAVLLFFAISKDHGDRTILSAIDKYLDNWINTTNSVYYQALSQIYYNRTVSKSSAKYLIRGLSFIFLLLLFLIVVILLLRKKINSKIKDVNRINIQIQKEKDKFKSYIENAPYGVFVTNKDGNYVEVNEKACDITHYNMDELVGKNISEMVPDEYHDKAFKDFQKLVNDGKLSSMLPYITKNGNIRYWTLEAIKISDDRFLGFVNDITNQLKDEEELQNLKNNLQLKVDEQTRELKERIEELERFHNATVEREFRIKELREEIESLKTGQSENQPANGQTEKK